MEEGTRKVEEVEHEKNLDKKKKRQKAAIRTPVFPNTRSLLYIKSVGVHVQVITDWESQKGFGFTDQRCDGSQH